MPRLRSFLCLDVAGAEAGQGGDAIAELAARIQAATYERLMMIHQFDARSGWSRASRPTHTG